MHVESVKVPTT